MKSLPLLLLLVSQICFGGDEPETDVDVAFYEFIEKIENLYETKGHGSFIYSTFLNEQIKDDERIGPICNSLVRTVNPAEITREDDFIWRCPRPLLSVWLGDFEEYAYKDHQVHISSVPIYPRDLRDLEGIVVIEFDIDDKGKLLDKRVLESTHEAFTESALEAFDHAIFTPAKRYGKRVKVSNASYKFTYQIQH